MFINLFTTYYMSLFQVFASIIVLEKGVSPLVPDSVGIQLYMDLENSDQLAVCTVQSFPRKCCLKDLKLDDCEKMYAYGAIIVTVGPKDKETLIHVYPTFIQHDQVGYCDFVIEHRCGAKRRRSKQVVTIPFDTRVFSDDDSDKAMDILDEYVKNKKTTECDSLDQDSLKGCSPVNCNLKYLGYRPYFNPKINECAVAPVCIADPEKDLPDTVYNPISNTCRDLDNPLTIKDIYEIGAGLYETFNVPHTTDEMMIELKSNCSTISQNLQLLKDIMCGRLYPYNGDTSQYVSCSRAAVASIFLTIAALCALVLGFICCLHMVACFSKRWSSGEIQEKWKSKKVSRSMTGNASKTDHTVKEALIRDLIARDWPIGEQYLNINICERMSKELRSKKRYRGSDIGNVSLKGVGDDGSSLTSSSDDENKSLINNKH